MNIVTNLPLKDQIAAVLRQEIAAGSLADGEELTQENVAAALAVSRIPVREAFLQLETEGLLRRLPNRHVQVVGLTPRRRRQNLRMLAALECEAARLLAETWNIQLPLSAFQALAAGGASPEQDAAFHRALFQTLDNPTLEQQHLIQRRSLFDHAARPLSADRAMQLDAAMVQAMQQQDTEGLCAAIRTYYDACFEEPLYESETD